MVQSSDGALLNRENVFNNNSEGVCNNFSGDLTVWVLFYGPDGGEESEE